MLKCKQKSYYDRTTKSLPSFKQDVVREQDANKWNRKAIVLEEIKPRSYRVQTETGQVLRRNQRSLMKTLETFNEHQHQQDLSNCTSEPKLSLPELSLPELEPELPLPKLSQNEQFDLPVLRRSSRVVKKPDR